MGFIRVRGLGTVPTLLSPILSLILVSGLPGAVKAAGCTPGEAVQYKAENWPERWATGTCLKPLPGGTQFLIREAPSQFYPEGFERAYSLDQIRPIGAAATGTDAAGTSPPSATPKPPAPTAVATSPATSPSRAASVGISGNGPMSEAEILHFLESSLGTGDPFANPARQQILDALRAEVLRRGVSFHLQSTGDFSNQLSRFGASTSVRYPIAENFGSPARADELVGLWRLLKVGAPTTFDRGGETWKRMEYFGDAGAVTVEGDGTYSWDSPSGLLTGRWRKATATEMSGAHKGGEGIVLVKAKSGGDWLLVRRTEEGQEGDGILLLGELPAYNLRERGVR